MKFCCAKKVRIAQCCHATMRAKVVMLNKSIALNFYVHIWALVAFACGLLSSKCIHHVEITISFPTHVSITAVAPKLLECGLLYNFLIIQILINDKYYVSKHSGTVSFD